jgi:hypothetical protein
MKLIFLTTAIVIVVVSGLLGVIVAQNIKIYELRRDKDALIELNHSKSMYIDAGCAEPYKGAEELLPGEPTQ